MGSAEYDDYYKPPWATSPHFEQRHRQLSAQIGTALKGGRHHTITENTNKNLFLDIGVLSYIILYGLLFYSVSDVNLRKWETPHSDHLLIKRVSRGDKYRNILSVFCPRWDISLIQFLDDIWRTDWVGTSSHSTCGTTDIFLVKWLRLRGFLQWKICNLMIFQIVELLERFHWTSYLDHRNMDEGFLFVDHDFVFIRKLNKDKFIQNVNKFPNLIGNFLSQGNFLEALFKVNILSWY